MAEAEIEGRDRNISDSSERGYSFPKGEKKSPTRQEYPFTRACCLRLVLVIA